jgi:hypothetical protein
MVSEQESNRQRLYSLVKETGQDKENANSQKSMFESACLQHIFLFFLFSFFFLP